MVLPAANWDDIGTQDTTSGSSHTAATPREAFWQLLILIGAATGLTKVELPVFNRDMPISGTKEARQSFLKLLAGMNKDVCPLAFRGEYKRNSNDKDPYYPLAPEWTTLGGGNNPQIVCSPLKICEDCISTAQCVPLVRNEVQIRILEADGTQTDATIDDVRTRNIQVKRVPRLPATQAAPPAPAHPPATGASSSNGPPPSSSEADALRGQVQMQATHMTALEAQIAELKALITANAAAVAPQRATATAVPATAATATGLPTALPTALQADQSEPTMSQRAASKRPRRG